MNSTNLELKPNNYKKSFYRILLYLVCALLLAALHASAQQTDTKAKAILDEVSAKTKTYKTISASFSISIENKDKKVNEKQEGSVVLKGQKFKLDLAGQTVFSDGKTQWTYLKESNEVQVNNANTNENSDQINPSNIFTIYEKGFKYEFVKDEGTTNIVKLYPIDTKKKSFHTVQLTIDKAKKQITAIKVNGKDGTTSYYTVKKFTPNIELMDAEFIFNKASHPGVEVIDLRD